ncbi:PTS lactose/cellobiose transporter subunit IIA [Neobacillus sp. YX16]|uniref:PTS lactose/cellobiose transporter subunit IIA n=1 Tax=Neobacillus sp. YX16 TaxID=3047874 RepID=UPI00105A174E|nr:PTS lactose/cellobiose transporter subunit IIA [Neobacillus sp. YX16]TDL74710.1 PTS lactose/cellobiose transporter subunit IIA [Rhodococcus qingshengii]WHZ05023.1 PTS lactose/cellobiose transporter subunit IIA [Neobacillus sp. YX16]
MVKHETEIFTLILHGGNGRSAAMEAIHAAKEQNMDLAREKLKEASDALNKAHHIQTSLIQSEIGGNPTEISLLMIHAQDHLMNAMTVKDLAKEFVDMYERGLK